MSEFEYDEHSTELRAKLVAQLKGSGALRSREKEDAFLAVPRELFAPDVAATGGLEAVYVDDSLVAKVAGGQVVSTSSQPSIMARMLQYLEPCEGEKILEIGAGTGYNAALLAQLVGPSGRVISVELDPELAERARQNLRVLDVGDRVLVAAADGWEGYAPEASYDRIIVTAQADDIAPAWFDQLKEGGHLVLPMFLSSDPEVRVSAVVGLRHQGKFLESFYVTGGSFIGMRGKHTVLGQESPASGIWVTFLSRGGGPVTVQIESSSLAHVLPVRGAALLATWLGEGRVASLSEAVPSVFDFALYLRLRYAGDELCTVRIDPPGVEQSLGQTQLGGIGFVDLENDSPSLALLTRPAWDQDTPSDSVLLCGPNAEDLQVKLVSVVREWKAMGSPGYRNLQIRVYRGNTLPELDPDSWVVPLRSVTLVLRYSRTTRDEASGSE